MLTLIEIPPDPVHKRAIPEDVVRCMYELMGSNMTKVIQTAPADWRRDDQFEKWRNQVFLGAVQQRTVHLLLSDGVGLRGFLSYTPSADGDGIFINELQIRPSCQGDAVTIRRLLREFAERIALLPHCQLRTYANKVNKRSQQLAARIGFRCTAQTARGYSYEMPKQAMLGWRGVRR